MEEIKGKTCCFTGHRPSKLPWKNNEKSEACIELKKKLYDVAEALYFSGVRHFICGMAAGSDMFFAEEVLKLKKTCPDITLEAAIPCPGQEESWTVAVRKRYNRLLEKCDKKTVISQEYTFDCMRRRNYYMVDRSSVIVAVYSGYYGGTMQTVTYAKKHDLEMIIIEP